MPVPPHPYALYYPTALCNPFAPGNLHTTNACRFYPYSPLSYSGTLQVLLEGFDEKRPLIPPSPLRTYTIWPYTKCPHPHPIDPRSLDPYSFTSAPLPATPAPYDLYTTTRANTPYQSLRPYPAHPYTCWPKQGSKGGERRQVVWDSAMLGSGVGWRGTLGCSMYGGRRVRVQTCWGVSCSKEKGV